MGLQHGIAAVRARPGPAHSLDPLCVLAHEHAVRVALDAGPAQVRPRAGKVRDKVAGLPVLAGGVVARDLGRERVHAALRQPHGAARVRGPAQLREHAVLLAGVVRGRARTAADACVCSTAELPEGGGHYQVLGEGDYQGSSLSFEAEIFEVVGDPVVTGKESAAEKEPEKKPEKELKRKEAENKEAERKEAEKKAAEKKEAETKEAKFERRRRDKAAAA